MPFTAEQTARLAAIQAKVLAGTDSFEDLKEGLAILRQDRINSQIASTAAKGRKAEAAKIVDPGSVLAELKGLGAKLQGGTFGG